MSTLKLDKTDNYYYYYHEEDFKARFSTQSAARFELEKIGLRIKKSSRQHQGSYIIWNVVKTK
jgi:C-terminal processing protease CtpA/Prc